MSFALWFIGLLVCPVLTVWFVVYPRLINDAHWYGWFSERLYLYGLPPFFAMASVACAYRVSDVWGISWPTWLEQVTMGTTGFLMLCGFFATLGVPVLPFLTPKWVRERRSQDREERRRRRREKNAAARRNEQTS
ncbi:hypothetical protein GCM10027060_08430 [Nesterenkonia halophila]|uniref:hypothetical protein n=1 Tax=Nesterenkonia halophila TaxID=302044 RepID=UPI001291D5F3|nr:hypothetical protein [Nesterenkonia halophila]